MIYLANPYSHADPAIREQRYHAACRATAAFLRAGIAVYAPVVHSHPLVAYGLPIDWRFWSRFDETFLGIAEAVVVLTLDGWRKSVGVREELRLAEEMGIPVYFVDAEDADLWIAEMGVNEKSPAAEALASPSHQSMQPTGQFIR